jgi:hypothetical protein
MHHPQLSGVQSVNLQFLHLIQVETQRDITGTCRRFGLQCHQAELLRGMSPAAIWDLVHVIGDSSLFVPRIDFAALIQCPPPLAATMSAVLSAKPNPPAQQ